MEMEIGVKIIRHVFTRSWEWSAIYFGNRKIWEGNNSDFNSMSAVTKILGAKYKLYEFTDSEEIEEEIPVSFMDIKGIKKLKL